MDAHSCRLLTINTGSSSLKAAVYQIDDGAPRRVLAAEARQIGLDVGHVAIVDAAGTTLLDRRVPLADHGAALDLVLGWLRDRGDARRASAVGHRVVHGGTLYTSPRWIDPTMLDGLRTLVPLAPDHLPQSIAAMAKVSELLPDVRQAACFDTSFHRTLPRHARLLPLPRAMADEGIVRFGFHGLSCEYLVDQLRTLDPERMGGRAVIAHLGGGASMTAVLQGKSVDTSMGFTPAGGLVMSTRSGDLDPGVLVYLLRSKGYTAESLDELCNRQSGLAGLSGIGPDMRALLERRATEPHAAEAIEVYCYQARKYLGAYAAALGGLDTLVFSGGIGENAPFIRQQICGELEFLGLHIDPQRNDKSDRLISTDTSPVCVRVIKTDEDLMIARHTHRLLTTPGE